VIVLGAVNPMRSKYLAASIASLEQLRKQASEFDRRSRLITIPAARGKTPLHASRHMPRGQLKSNTWWPAGGQGRKMSGTARGSNQLSVRLGKVGNRFVLQMCQ
jgi:hypothetical protein